MTRKTIIACSAAAILVAAISVCAVMASKYKYSRLFYRQVGLSVPAGIKAYGKPDATVNALMGMSVEAYEGNWDKVASLFPKNSKSIIAGYYRNLANYHLGCLPDSLMYAPQHFCDCLFLPVGETSSRFQIECSGEVWYRIGDPVMAEHNTILGMIFSPVQGGPRFYERLAQINYLSGDYDAAAKYEYLLGRKANPEWMSYIGLAPTEDKIHNTDPRTVLRMMLEAYPDNRAAYEYLLCSDLLLKDMKSFMSDYRPGYRDSRLFEEAAISYLAGTGQASPETLVRNRVTQKTYEDFVEYSNIFERSRDPKDFRPRFGHTYWYYYNFFNGK